MKRTATEPPGALSYGQVLADRRLAALLLGDMFSQIANGMIIVALPMEALRIHGTFPASLAVSLVATAPFVLATVLSLAMGLGRRRPPPRVLLLTDCVLRSLVSGTLGVLALTDALSLPLLIVGLLMGSSFRLVGSSSRRLLATGMVGAEGRLAVNGLLGSVSSGAQYIAGPVIGGLLVVTKGPGLALLFDGAAALLLLVVVATVVPRPPSAGRPAPHSEKNGDDHGAAGPVSGWRVLRANSQAARLFVVVCCFNFFYMPVEIALPLLVRGPLDADGAGLGLLWGMFGAGAFVGALGINQLRRLPVQPTLVTAIALWALCPIGLATAGDFWPAAVVFTLGGLVWAPFTPLVYTFLQSTLNEMEQQPVVTLWAAGTSLAAPAGLSLGGPLVQLLGVRPSLAVSGLLTALLVPVAGWGLLRTGRAAQDKDPVTGRAGIPSPEEARDEPGR
ncbi:MFS transporter [Streptomyces sp. NPDC050161]|uniref:MFS transporter n=1 Tax=Streptomyces sp. NPDC050161 TaxID=3365604 RepID=UPI0037ADFD15